jgi:predicted HicB family RNase H-like nuclease
MSNPVTSHVPYADSRIVSTRITPEVHRALRECAAKEDCAVAAVIKKAVASYLTANIRN